MTKAAELAKMGEVLTNSQIGGRRNIIINGAMQVAQRGTSTSSVSSGNIFASCDRWRNTGVTIGTWTISQSTDVPTGQGFAKSLKYDCTTAEASPSAGDQLHLSHRIEGQDLQQLKKGTSNAEKVTLSFWVKSNKTGTYQVNIRDKDNTRMIAKTYAISSADTWEKKTLTFDGDTTGVLDNDNANSLELEWFLGAGSNYTSGAVPTSWEAESATDRAAGLNVNLGDSTDNEWYITGVQLEVGSQATPFEHRSFGEELDLCYRYYVKYHAGGSGTLSRIALGFMRTTTNLRALFTFPREMRSTPALDDDNASNYHVEDAAGGSDVDATVASISQGGFQTCLVNFTTGSLTNNLPAHVGVNDSTDKLVGLGFDAELQDII